MYADFTKIFRTPDKAGTRNRRKNCTNERTIKEGNPVVRISTQIARPNQE